MKKPVSKSRPAALPFDDVNRPKHYASSPIECIDAIGSMLGVEGQIAFLRGQVIKYTWRMMAKNAPIQDAEKAQWYMNRLVAEIKKT
jgi:hypothetical protein